MEKLRFKNINKMYDVDHLHNKYNTRQKKFINYYTQSLVIKFRLGKILVINHNLPHWKAIIKKSPAVLKVNGLESGLHP